MNYLWLLIAAPLLTPLGRYYFLWLTKTLIDGIIWSVKSGVLFLAIAIGAIFFRSKK